MVRLVPFRSIASAVALTTALLAPRASPAQESLAPPADRQDAAPLESVADAPLAYHLARQARSGGDLERAAALLEIAVELDPGAVLPRLDRVEVLLELNRPRGARGLLDPIAGEVEAGVDDRPSTAARYHRLRGAIALRSGETSRAIEGYERAAALAPWDLGLRAQLIGLHRASGDPAAAIPHLEAATRVLPFNAEIRTELGDALVELERYREAEEAYRDALRLAPPASELHDAIERKIDRVRAAAER